MAPPNKSAAQKKYDAATAALQRVAQKDQALAQKTAQDWVYAAFTVNAAVNSDLARIRAISPGDAATIAAALGDRDVQALAAQGLLSPVTGAIGGALGPAASRVGNLPEGTLAATAAGLNVTYDVLKPLFQANIWIRVGEVALGIILIAVGLARITNAIPIATKIAKTAGMVAAA
ncbi:hypothetical protein GCM10009527_097920 [Actinomadura nitritigenes]|jgi:hypothetical protein|uniref:Uncharacterized protein n=1 Tax=Actinomadura nitritigenes TaxID=134602 RepID=A0ABS3QXW6_9ACTN|nr:hypothetical protein [Actinomadura nitritigenes]MBO2438278.1 hypothetical protein [Actinomadura nitritigenes]